MTAILLTLIIALLLYLFVWFICVSIRRVTGKGSTLHKWAYQVMEIFDSPSGFFISIALAHLFFGGHFEGYLQ